MEDSAPSVITTLLRTMDSSPGFAGLGSSIETISRLGDDVDAGPREITATILRDAALTAKLLRIANSSRNARGGRNISTIDQALVILGLNTVKSVALSLALLGSLSRKPQSNLLHAEIVAAYFCGTLAAEITRCNGARYSAQEAQVCGLLQNLGRMMATYHLYEGIERSRAIQAERNIADTAAPAYGKLLQQWYADLVGARSFVVLPLLSEGKLLGLVYGDYAEPHASSPSDLAEASMREWREQLVQALRRGATKSA